MTSLLLNRTRQRLASIPQPQAALLLLLLIFAPFLFLSKLVSPYPNGYAGLYTLMAERIAANGFISPATIPFYGPGGIPFAYPPLAFFLMAAVTTFFKVQPFDYLRFAPSLFYLLSLVPMYTLSREITASTRKAVLATVLMGTSAGIIANHYGADGMCRGLGLLFMLWALFFACRAFQTGRWQTTALAVLFLALTFLTHLSYAVAGTLSILVFALFVKGVRPLERIWILGAIGAGSALGSMLWWLPVIQRLGLQTLLNTLNTHGNLNPLGGLPDPASLLFQLRLVFFPRYEMPGFMLAIIAGLLLLLLTKKPFLPVWILVLALACGTEGQRFVAIVGALLGAYALDWVYGKILAFKYPRKQIAQMTGLAYWLILLVLFIMARGNPFAIDGPALTSFFTESADLSRWFRDTQPPDVSYLLLSNVDSQQEWLPYLLRHPSAISPFGAEWTGQYPHQLTLYNKILVDCTVQSLDCVLAGLDQAGVKPGLLITPIDSAPGSLASALGRDARWQRIYTNQGFAVWRALAQGG